MLIYLRMIETAEDQSKFEHIYLEYRKLMFCVALKYLKCEQDAEDAVHQAFVKIAENIKDVEPVSPKTRQYVVTIVENRAMDVLRMRSKHPILPLSETMSTPMEELDDEAFLSKCIKRLTDQQRQIIWLKYYFGYNLHEIAKMMDIKLSWAQKIDQRAKKKLEEMLKEGGRLL